MLTIDELEIIYAQGVHEYRNENYKNALKIFSHLLIHSPEEDTYLEAQAAAAFMAKQFKVAADSYLLLFSRRKTMNTLTFAIKSLVFIGKLQEARFLTSYIDDLCIKEQLYQTYPNLIEGNI